MTDEYTKEWFDKIAWATVETMFRSDVNFLVRHQIDTFDDFIDTKLEQIITSFNPIEIPYQYDIELEMFCYKMFVTFVNPTLTLPMIYEKDGSVGLMTPSLARNRNFTYSSTLYIDIIIDMSWWDNGVMNEGRKRFNSVSFGKIPVMVNSSCCVLRSPTVLANENMCKHDKGGYFIINGNEKVVVCQDRIAENRCYVFRDTKSTMYEYYAEIRSVNDESFGAPKLTTLKMCTKPMAHGKHILVKIHYMKSDIPLFVLFRALGVETDKEILSLIMGETDPPHDVAQHYEGCVYMAKDIRTQLDAIKYISTYINMSSLPKDVQNIQEYRSNMVWQTLQRDFLPHVGENSLQNKAFYLAQMTSKMMGCYLGIESVDDRDSYLNKRVDTPGMLMASLFRQYFHRLVKEMKSNVYKEMCTGTWKTTNDPMGILNMNNLYKVIKYNTIESGIKYALSTGNWGLKNMNSKQGVAQVLNRMTYNATISHLRRVNTPMEKSGKLIQPRKLHNTQWGIICPSETPEGGSVGIVKNLSIGAIITVSSSKSTVLSRLSESGVHDFKPLDVMSYQGKTKVLLNGSCVGTHDDPGDLMAKIRRMRRDGIFHAHTSVSWIMRRNEVWISTDGGRIARPLFIAYDDTPSLFGISSEKDVKLLLSGERSWVDLVHAFQGDRSVVEYVDVEESNSTLIAMSYKDLKTSNPYTHIEIHPSLMFGVMAANVPFANHNQAPRVTYQSAMGKQAIGIYMHNYDMRLDTMAHVLHNPQVPLVKTKLSDLIGTNQMSSGQNLIVAISTFTGYNQEDSVMVNRAAVERGMLNSTFYRTYKEHCNKNHSTGEEELFCNPKLVSATRIKPYNYDKLKDDGFVPENTYVKNGDIIIGRCMPNKVGDRFVYKDNSVVIKGNESGFVDLKCANDKLFRNVNNDGYTFAKVRIRNMRSPEVGDKVSSRHGQKGTIGMVYNHEDMPFTSTGLVPDIIMNPHAVPSRMTIGQLLESLLGVVVCDTGTFGDGTPFNETDVNEISSLLAKHGFNPHGNEIMYNPRTGEQMRTLVFIGPTFYQRLKHMVVDKIHSRSSSGPIVLMTRQPSEGRARDGGLRLGEMEVECNWAHGCMAFLKERIMECSDNYRVFVCHSCKSIADINPDVEKYTCKSCGNSISFSQIRIPYACKLMLHEIQAMNVNTQIYT
jgi:DNA-directed RNA polymerase II subunit RPB2